MAQEVLSIPTITPYPARRGRLLWRLLIALVTVIVVGVLPLLWYVGVFGGNFRVVVPGRVYRSAELTGGLLDSVLTAYHIRTVINLRGESPNDGWYRSEQASCAHLGVSHVDVALSAVRMPPPDQLQKLLAAFDTAAYPILFHCRGGADRSGLAGTLYLNLYQGVPLDQAQARQLTWRYGHLSWGQAHAMDDFFALYRRTGGGLGLRAWISARYPALYAALPPAERTPGPDVSPAAPGRRQSTGALSSATALPSGH